MEGDKHRVVLDTNQIVAAGTSWVASGYPDPKTLVQQMVLNVARSHTGLYSREIAAEYLKKLVERNNPLERIKELIGCVLELFERIEVSRTECERAPTDGDDTKFILCALDGGAHYLVTEDRHLLALKSHYQQPIIGRRDDLSRFFEVAAQPVAAGSASLQGQT